MSILKLLKIRLQIRTVWVVMMILLIFFQSISFLTSYVRINSFKSSIHILTQQNNFLELSMQQCTDSVESLKNQLKREGEICAQQSEEMQRIDGFLKTMSSIKLGISAGTLPEEGQDKYSSFEVDVKDSEIDSIIIEVLDEESSKRAVDIINSIFDN